MNDKEKNVLIVNSKGSVGKTPTGFNLAFDLGMKIQTNDLSALLGCYKEFTTLTHDLTVQSNTLYDLGGFVAPKVLEIVKNVDLVIVPVNNDPSSLIHTKSILKQMLPISKKLIVITTKTENNDKIKIQEDLEKKYPNLEYFDLPLTKAFSHSLKYGKSIKKLVEIDSKQENWFGDYFINYYEPLLNYVRTVIKG